MRVCARAAAAATVTPTFLIGFARMEGESVSFSIAPLHPPTPLTPPLTVHNNQTTTYDLVAGSRRLPCCFFRLANGKRPGKKKSKQIWSRWMCICKKKKMLTTERGRHNYSSGAERIAMSLVRLWRRLVDKYAHYKPIFF